MTKQKLEFPPDPMTLEERSRRWTEWMARERARGREGESRPDIVGRLRGDAPDRETLLEAAEEIEKLRETVGRLNRQLAGAWITVDLNDKR